jgi:hypothetical protein
MAGLISAHNAWPLAVFAAECRINALGCPGI